MRPKRITGVIIKLNRGSGVMLCRHKKHVIIDYAVEAYIKDPSGTHWLAGFHLSNVDNKSIEKAYAELTRLKYRNEKLPELKQKKLTLADVMIGMVVTCRAEKSAKWSVDNIKFIPGVKPFWIPLRLRGPASKVSGIVKRKRAKPKREETRFTRRIAAAAKTGNNLRRPWRG